MRKMRLREVKELVEGLGVGHGSSRNATQRYLTEDLVYFKPHFVASYVSQFPPADRAPFLQASCRGEALGPACARHTVHPAGETACSQLRDGRC